MNRLQQALVWLKRVGHSRGFGIQSPTDFRFVCNVVKEHWPYYAYAAFPQGDHWQRRKLGRLYFRLANHFQPAVVLDLVGVGEYVQAGCRKAVLTTNATTTPDLVIIPSTLHPSPFTLLSLCTEKTVLVVEDIGRHPDAWQTILSDSRPTVTFDLYYCGIALFNPQRSPQHYVVNF